MREFSSLSASDDFSVRLSLSFCLLSWTCLQIQILPNFCISLFFERNRTVTKKKKKRHIRDQNNTPELLERRTIPSSRFPFRITVSDMNTTALETKWFFNTQGILTSHLLVTTLSINIFYPPRKIDCLLMPCVLTFTLGFNVAANMTTNTWNCTVHDRYVNLNFCHWHPLGFVYTTPFIPCRCFFFTCIKLNSSLQYGKNCRE